MHELRNDPNQNIEAKIIQELDQSKDGSKMETSSILQNMNVSSSQPSTAQNASNRVFGNDENFTQQEIHEKELLDVTEAPTNDQNTSTCTPPTTKTPQQQSNEQTSITPNATINVVESGTSFSSSNTSPPPTFHLQMSTSALKNTRTACIECRKSHQKCQPADRDMLIALKKDLNSSACKRCCGLGLPCIYIEAKKRGRKERPKNVVSAMTNTFVSSNGKISVTTQNLLKDEEVEYGSSFIDGSKSPSTPSFTPQEENMFSQVKRRRMSATSSSTNPSTPTRGSNSSDSLTSTASSPSNSIENLIHSEKASKKNNTMDFSTSIASNSSSSPVIRPLLHAPYFPLPPHMPSSSSIHPPPLPHTSYPFTLPSLHQVTSHTYVPSLHSNFDSAALPNYSSSVTTRVMANSSSQPTSILPKLPSLPSMFPAPLSSPHVYQNMTPQQSNSTYAAPRLESLALPPIQEMKDPEQQKK